METISQGFACSDGFVFFRVGRSINGPPGHSVSGAYKANSETTFNIYNYLFVLNKDFLYKILPKESISINCKLKL